MLKNGERSSREPSNSITDQNKENEVQNGQQLIARQPLLSNNKTQSRADLSEDCPQMLPPKRMTKCQSEQRLTLQSSLGAHSGFKPQPVAAQELFREQAASQRELVE